MNPNSTVSVGRQLRSWWDSLSDDDKQAALDTVGELAGGTVGAMAGSGVASIPAAGAGSVVGKGAARLAGQAIGLHTKPQSGADIAKDAAVTFATNAAGEGLGRAVAPAYRGVKSLAKRGLQIAARTNPEIARLAEQAGVPLTAGMLSDSPGMKIIETALEKYPGSTDVIRGARQKSYDAWGKSVEGIGNKLGPKASNQEAGEALKEGLESNFRARKEHFAPRYSQVASQANGIGIDMTPARDVARGILENVTPDTSRFFPGDTVKKLQKIAGLGQSSKEFIDNGVSKIIPVDELPELTFQEAQALRTQLLEANRALSRSDAAFDRQAIPALLSRVDESIGTTLKKTNPEAYAKWREVSGDYKNVATKLSSPTAQKIDREVVPERLPQAIASKPTMISEAEVAANPSTIDSLTSTPPRTPNPMDKVRRNRFDDLLESSRTQDRFTGDERYINPRTLERKAEKMPASELFGDETTRELGDSVKLGKAVTSPEFLYGNSSGTGRANLYISSGVGLGSTVYGDGDLSDRVKRGAAIGMGVYALPKLAAKAITSPRLTRALTPPPPPLSSPIGGPLMGAAGRAIMGMAKMPESKQDSSLPADFLAEPQSADLPDDFIDQQATERMRRSRPPALSTPR